MEKVDRAIKILQAFKEGKTIEYNYKDSERLGTHWVKWEREVFGCEFDFKTFKYRIGKEPKYRPYKNAEEFLQASKKHGEWIRLKDSNEYYKPITVTNDLILVASYVGSAGLVGYTFVGHTFEHLEDYVWQDGTPCGVLKEE